MARTSATDRPRSLDEALDAALALPTGRVRAYVDGIRRKRPHATPEEVVRLLEKRYLLAVSTSGGAVGAAAALPVVGTGTALALTVGQVATFLGASSLLALAVADVHGIAVEDRARRRALLLTALLGENGPEVLQQELGLSAVAWGRTLLTRLPVATVQTVNKTLRGRLVKGTAAKVGSVMLGRLLPFGIGAAVGYAGSRAVGGTMIDGVRSAFGPPPATFVREVEASFVVEPAGDAGADLDTVLELDGPGSEPEDERPAS
ncbi:MAG TPA: hypothetical protein VKY71_04400 [Actinotalea caeni]|uniref:hypothetical protein n=1 Tax=Actinotalea caeni TaxID=1348467 RepID=UPI002B4B5A8F|nr:hypothetical protein [Actinotalea caeni]HLV54796.1 hypothetical protein [Actinotalea caeni]